MRLFLHCDMSINVWLNLMWWFGNNFIMPPKFVYSLGTLERDTDSVAILII